MNVGSLNNFGGEVGGKIYNFKDDHNDHTFDSDNAGLGAGGAGGYRTYNGQQGGHGQVIIRVTSIE